MPTSWPATPSTVKMKDCNWTWTSASSTQLTSRQITLFLIQLQKGWKTSHNIKIDKKSSEEVEQFKYLRTILIYQKSIRAAHSHGMPAIIRCRIFCLPVCYQKNIKIKIYSIIILSVVLYGCEICSLTQRGRNTHLGCSRTGCWRRYSCIRGTTYSGLQKTI